MAYDKNVAETILHDINLECVDCPNVFAFTVGEQQFYLTRGYAQPKRCPACREKKKKQKLANA